MAPDPPSRGGPAVVRRRPRLLAARMCHAAYRGSRPSGADQRPAQPSARDRGDRGLVHGGAHRARPPRPVGFWGSVHVLLALGPRHADSVTDLLGAEAGRHTAGLADGEINLFPSAGVRILRVDVSPWRTNSSPRRRDGPATAQTIPAAGTTGADRRIPTPSDRYRTGRPGRTRFLPQRRPGVHALLTVHLWMAFVYEEFCRVAPLPMYRTTALSSGLADRTATQARQSRPDDRQHFCVCPTTYGIRLAASRRLI